MDPKNMNESEKECKGQDKIDIKDLLMCERYFHTRMNQIRQYIIDQLRKMANEENQAKEDFKKKIEESKIIIDNTKNEKERQEKIYSFLKMISEDSRTNYANIITQSLFLNIFSLFDAFIGNFLQIMYTLRPCLLNSENKQVSVSKILESNSIEDFKRKYLRELIDNFRRDSYVAQVENMQAIFHIKTLIAFEHWSTFVEITQRRNIIKHCDGKVSQEYIDICKKHGCSLESIEVGTQLSIDLDYLVLSINIIEEVAIKLLHTIWRKQLSDSIELSDRVLISCIYNLLLDENWILALCLSEFGMNQNNIFKEENLIILTINHCIALYNMGKKDELREVLNNIDFSAKNDEYKLAKAVLFDEYDRAYELMKRIGTNGLNFKQDSYMVFPLFNHIRKEDQFKNIYKEIFKNSDYRETEREIEKSRDIEQDVQEDIEKVNI